VVSVSSSADPAPRITATDYLSQFSPCAIDAITYTGSIPPVVAGQAGRPSIIWAPQIRFQYTTVGPDRVQRAGGQHWSACVIGSTDDVPFTGRLENVLTDGTLPSAFGSCLSSADLASAREVPCDQPHATEILGASSTGPVPVDSSDAQQACEVFAEQPAVLRPLIVLRDIGLGYLRLGQSATELSGGEAQRIKLATELQRIQNGTTIYILDEPTTGLHPSDVDKLLHQLDVLVEAASLIGIAAGSIARRRAGSN
jgi:hypothetical protein